MRIGYICSNCGKYVNREKDPDHYKKCIGVINKSKYELNVIIPAGFGSKAIFSPEHGRVIDDHDIAIAKENGKLMLSNEEIAQECDKHYQRNMKAAITAGNKEMKESIMQTLSQKNYSD